MSLLSKFLLRKKDDMSFACLFILKERSPLYAKKNSEYFLLFMSF